MTRYKLGTQLAMALVVSRTGVLLSVMNIVQKEPLNMIAGEL